VTHEPLTPSTDRTERRIHVALPVRVTYYDNQAKPRLEMACTYDISAHGARVTGLRCVKEAGEILVVERGRSKAFCRVCGSVRQIRTCADRWAFSVWRRRRPCGQLNCATWKKCMTQSCAIGRPTA